MMRVNLILAGLRKEQMHSALERMEALAKSFFENVQIACLNFHKDCQEELQGWLSRYEDGQLWQVEEEIGFRQMLSAAKAFEEDNASDLTLVCGTGIGKRLAQQLAAKSGKACHVDVQTFENIDGTLYASRKIYSTHVDGLFEAEKAIVILSLTGEKCTCEISEDPGGLQIHEIHAEQKDADDYLIKEEMLPQMEDLSKAKIVLLGGKGLGSKANFERLEALAEKLGASCGCTRPVALSAWAPYEKVVGISGWKLQADVCIAFGVAGAGPLMQGVEGVGKLVAINNDEKAQIFRHADYGVVEDCIKILEAMENAAE